MNLHNLYNVNNNIILMSLLTSSSLTKQHKKFISKMQQYYHKRGSSQYIPKQRTQPLSFTTKISSQAIQKIKITMQEFMTKIQNIVKQFNMLDHYGVLEILRKHQFFSDVAIHIQCELYHKIEILEKQVIQKQQKIIALKKQLKSTDTVHNQKLQRLQTLNDKNMIKYNVSKSLASNLYYHARAMSQEDFTNFYNKISLSNAITLKKIQNTQTKIKEQFNIGEKLNQLIKYGKFHNNQDAIEKLTVSVKQLVASRGCKNPCCQQKTDCPDIRLNKAKTLINSTFSKPSKDVYKNDKTQEYFKRYYRGSSFNVHDVTSVSKTKAEQMQRIEDEYRKNVKQRKKNDHHRYSSSFTRQ